MIAFNWGFGGNRLARGTAWLRSCGSMSYEIYLTHMFVVLPVIGLFHLTGASLRFGGLWLMPVLLLSWRLGSVVDRTLSRPADRLIRGRLASSVRVQSRRAVQG